MPVERAKRPEHGDFASNVAMMVAKAAGKPPREVAEAIVARLPIGGGLAAGRSDGRRARVHQPAARAQLLAGDRCRRSWPPATTGGGAPRAARRTSCSSTCRPTRPGPITVAHGRHAAVGDSLTRLLRFAGYPVTAEYYINDAGNQVQMLALSVWTRYMEAARAADPAVPEVAFPENGYKGDYIRTFGRELFARDGTRWVGTAPPADIEPIKQFAIDRCAGDDPRRRWRAST